MNNLRRGLYAIADSGLIPAHQLIAKVTLALEGGACLVQFRAKGNDSAQREKQALELLNLCHRCAVPLLINDDVPLAARIGAAGVHLGQNDLPLAQARLILGPDAIIGVSCQDNLAFARQAEQAGASYVAFGRFFPSHTKPDASQADPAILSAAQRHLQIPVAAIGGITPDNAPLLIKAGADLLAVIHGLFAQDDIRATATQFARLFG